MTFDFELIAGSKVFRVAPINPDAGRSVFNKEPIVRGTGHHRMKCDRDCSRSIFRAKNEYIARVLDESWYRLCTAEAQAQTIRNDEKPLCDLQAMATDPAP
jgi:hypothetical protein